MIPEETKRTSNIKAFNPKKSIKRAWDTRAASPKWIITTSVGEVTWGNKAEKVAIIRKGLPYESIEVIGKKANMPVRQLLQYLDVPQTTYNKKKREKALLSVRDSEIVLLLSEILDFGNEVFNNEQEKFQRWLKKPNLTLGNVTPKSLFDSVTGIQEVRNALNRLEYGNMA
jgi:putative toxin-antitoxin system antitoxin component (TIGR02293 family)